MAKKKLDDKQILFLSKYLDPKSKTFSNALQSALAVGYSRSYAESICNLCPDWLSENIGKRKYLLVKAERNLDEHLDLDIRDKKINSGVLAIKHKATEFVAETLGKEMYSKRNEITGADGKDFFLDDKEKAKLDEFLNLNK